MSSNKEEATGLVEVVESALAALEGAGCSPAEAAEARRALGNALVSMPPEVLTNGVLGRIDGIWSTEASGRRPLAPDTLPGTRYAVSVEGGDLPVRTKLLAWRGDITTLKVDAIVNAANDQGLGCFAPSHRCIDNAIHRAAGPRLREECAACMRQRGSPLSAGTAPIVTDAYHLPCKKVLHVTGPQLRPGSQPTREEAELLSLCYSKCLDACLDGGFESVAFNCLSTGVFAYPPDLAAAIALETVRSWLSEHRPPHLKCVIFDVFTPGDAALYAEAMPRFFKSLSPGPPAEGPGESVGDGGPAKG